MAGFSGGHHHRREPAVGSGCGRVRSVHDAVLRDHHHRIIGRPRIAIQSHPCYPCDRVKISVQHPENSARLTSVATLKNEILRISRA